MPRDASRAMAELEAIISELQPLAADDDLVYWDYLTRNGEMTTEMYRMFTHYRIQTVVLTCDLGAELTVFERLETMTFLALSAFCQRLANPSEKLLENLQLEKLMDLPNLLKGLSSGRGLGEVAAMLDSVLPTLTPVCHDVVGFRIFVEEANIAWLPYPYVKELASKLGPFPRRQCLDQSRLIIGKVPAGRLVVVSHGWDTEFHISPSGDKMRLILEEMERIGATGANDVVFVDFCGLPQGAADSMPNEYFEHNSTRRDTFVDRTPLEKRQFGFALAEMSRMYAFCDVSVVVLPQLADLSSLGTKWGRANEHPYLKRGWCCSEFAIAKYHGTVVNDDRPDVQAVYRARVWPETVREYGQMMAMKGEDGELLVKFTKKGDAALVSSLFYRVCFGMLDSFYPNSEAPTGYVAPTVDMLKAAEQLVVGGSLPACLPACLPAGRPAREPYYLYVAIPPPVVVSGDSRPSHLQLLNALQTLHLAAGVRRRQSPVCFGDALKRELERDLVAGNVHTLVWGGLGTGWECNLGRGKAPMTFEQLCEVFAKLGRKKRQVPHCVFLCMPFGARRAAESLLKAGAPLIVWVSCDLYDADRAALVLQGICAPLLEAMHEPRASPELLQTKLQRLRRGWDGGLLFSASSHASLPLPVWKSAGNKDVHLAAKPIAGVGSSEELYEHIKVIARKPDSQQLVDLLDRGDSRAIVGWIDAALHDISADGASVAALYRDVDVELGEVPVLQVRLHVDSVGFLHELRDLTLTGELDRRLSHLPLDGERFDVTINRAAFALSYEASVLSLEKLTPHQQEKLRECKQQGVPYLHLKAPAGAGKTFVALNLLLDELRADARASVLFVARNKPLCYFVVRWICTREKSALKRVELLSRIHVLFEPFDCPHVVTLVRGHIEMNPLLYNWVTPTLVVVDEAHHIYKEAELQEAVEVFVRPPSTQQRLLLLSDISQSDGSNIAYPGGTPKVVALTEVVRSSQRIVSGASAFQLGDDKQQIVCQHSASGPPLKSFLFEPSEPRDVAYASQTVHALKHVISTFGSLSLHDRVAILVPDEEFADAFRGCLAAALREGLPGRRFKLICATEAAGSVSPGGKQRDSEEALVVDTVANFDGLERLVVIAVDLDAVIDSASSETLELRSRLYRALTRAHMMAIVVNAFLEGGFFAFLGQVKLKKEEFDREAAIGQQKSKAIEALMAALLEGSAEEGSAGVGTSQLKPKLETTKLPGSSQSKSKTVLSQPKTVQTSAVVTQVRQSIWDTSSNAAIVAGAHATFNPFKRTPAEEWRELGGGDLEPVLVSGAVALLDAQWIINHAEAGGVLNHRQALPKEAFLSFTDLVEAGCPRGTLPVAVISHPWLTKDHPDPRGANLSRVARALKALLNSPDIPRLGVFLDFVSLHQHPDPANGVMRTEEENALFKQGLACIGMLYSHQYAWVLRLTSFPDGHKAEDQAEGTNVARYFDRGWCFFEDALASLTKASHLSLDLGKMRDGEEYFCSSLIDDCTKEGGRRPPLLPSAFAAELGTKSFTNGIDDKPLVRQLYEAVFEEQFGKATELQYNDLGWGDAEAAQVAEVLASGAAPRLETLHLGGNQIRDEGCNALAAALGKEGAAPRLETLNLHDNEIGDEGCKTLAAALKEGAAPSLKTLLVGSKPPELVAACEERGINLN